MRGDGRLTNRIEALEKVCAPVSAESAEDEQASFEALLEFTDELGIERGKLVEAFEGGGMRDVWAALTDEESDRLIDLLMARCGISDLRDAPANWASPDEEGDGEK